MICVLDVTAGPAQGKRFWIRNKERMEIGRISTADFSVPTDKHMSRHHLILEGGSDCFRIRDVGSANGTFVNDAKVATIELCNGDLIKAGETIFEVSVIHDSKSLTDPKESTSVSSALTSDSSQSRPVIAVAHHNSDSTDRSSGESLVQQSISSERSGEAAVAVAGVGEEWSSFGFRQTESNRLLKQVAEGDETDASKNTPSTLSEILPKLAAKHCITTILRTDRLRRFEQQLLDKVSQSKNTVQKVAENTAAVLDFNSEDLRFLMESLIGRDAMLVVASPSSLSSEHLAEISSFLPPSAFEQHLARKPGEETNANLEACSWIMLEQSGSELLQVWVNDQPSR